MKVRREILKSRTAILLSGAMSIIVGSASATWAADTALPVKAPPAAETGWYYYGELDAGILGYIQKPPSGFGYGGPYGSFLLPTQTNSIAKFEEYGKIPSGLFLDWFYLGAGTKDGKYNVDVWGRNVGVNNQSYGLDFAQNGFQYLTLGWDQTPHLYSTSAKSLFGGVGSTTLTVPDAVQNALSAQYTNATANTAAGLTARQTINNIITANSTPFDIETKRDTFAAAYRITPTTNWDINLDYDHVHRSGTKPGTLDYTYPAGFPSNVIAVPIPVDDTTQDANASGEYAGTGSWGKYSVKFAYNGSFYNDSLTTLTADNPFSRTGAQLNFGTLRLGLPPSNQANSFTASGATDIPIFKSRFTTTNQWSRMTQNDAFMNTSNNGLVADPMPQSSLNGVVNTFLTNNVLTSKFSDNVWNTLRVRYYERNNDTSPLTFANQIYADSELSAGPFTPADYWLSYNKLNISEDLKWKTSIKGLTVGAGYDFQRYNYTNMFVTQTNENTGRVFADYELAKYAMWRNSYSYAARRYDSYEIDPTADFANGRMFDISNRNRQVAKSELELVVNRFVMVTPYAGLRWDDYPTTTPVQTGVSSEHTWNAGVQVAVTPSPAWRVTAGYTYEWSKLDMAAVVPDAGGVGQCNFTGYGGPFGYTAGSACAWSDNLTQKYQTFIGTADWTIIPSKLDLRLDYIASWSNEAHDFTPCTLAVATAYNCNGISVTAAGVTTAQVNLPWPTNSNLYQHFGATLRYYVDPDWVRQTGFKGQVVARLRYMYERNSGSAWQSDSVNSYFGTLSGNTELTGTSRSIWLAYNNPNYQAQIIAASIGLKW